MQLQNLAARFKLRDALLMTRADVGFALAALCKQTRVQRQGGIKLRLLQIIINQGRTATRLNSLQMYSIGVPNFDSVTRAVLPVLTSPEVAE